MEIEVGVWEENDEGVFKLEERAYEEPEKESFTNQDSISSSPKYVVYFYNFYKTYFIKHNITS